MSENVNLNALPYAEWLEKAMHDLVKMPIEGLCFTAILKSGEAYTNYYNISMMNKLTIAGLIQQDAMLDSMAANGFIEYADEEEGDSDGQEED